MSFQVDLEAEKSIFANIGSIIRNFQTNPREIVSRG